MCHPIIANPANPPMQKFLYAPRAANKKKNEPALFQLSKEDALLEIQC
jgi:hypothetical protein